MVVADEMPMTGSKGLLTLHVQRQSQNVNTREPDPDLGFNSSLTTLRSHLGEKKEKAAGRSSESPLIK